MRLQRVPTTIPRSLFRVNRQAPRGPLPKPPLPPLPPLSPRLEKRIQLIENLGNVSSHHDMHKGALRILLASRSSRSAERINFLERGVIACLNRKDIFSASLAYQELRSRRGKPSPELTNRILEAVSKYPYPLPVEALRAIARAVLYRATPPTLEQFHALLRIIRYTNDPLHVHKLVNRFTFSHGIPSSEVVFPPQTVANIIRAYDQAGGWEFCENWFDRFEKVDLPIHLNLEPAQDLPPVYTLFTKMDPTPPSESELALPYVALMTAYGHHFPFEPGHVQRVFNDLVKESITPPPRAFNILLAALARAGVEKHSEIFNLYSVFIKHYRPDAFTFGTLFSALDKRKYSDGAPSRGAPTPRRLFKHMLIAHRFRTHGRPRAKVKRPAMTTGVLNLALRYYMRTRDYPAAVIVLRAFGICAIKPDRMTEWIVNAYVMKRVVWELGLRRGTWARSVHARGPRLLGSREGKFKAREGPLIRHSEVLDALAKEKGLPPRPRRRGRMTAMQADVYDEEMRIWSEQMDDMTKEASIKTVELRREQRKEHKLRNDPRTKWSRLLLSSPQTAGLSSLSLRSTDPHHLHALTPSTFVGVKAERILNYLLGSKPLNTHQANYTAAQKSQQNVWESIPSYLRPLPLDENSESYNPKSVSTSTGSQLILSSHIRRIPHLTPFTTLTHHRRYRSPRSSLSNNQSPLISLSSLINLVQHCLLADMGVPSAEGESLNQQERAKGRKREVLKVSLKSAQATMVPQAWWVKGLEKVSLSVEGNRVENEAERDALTVSVV